MRFLTILSFLVFTSCSTIITQDTKSKAFKSITEMPPSESIPHFYSGVMTNVHILRSSFQDYEGEYPNYERDMLFAVTYALIDMPFSLIADTVIFPITLYKQIKYGPLFDPGKN